MPDWLQLSPSTMAWIAGVLLAIYSLGIVYALTAPSKGPDPQRGQAIGCLGIVLVALLVIGLLLALGVITDASWLVRIIFFVVVFPVFSLAGSCVYQFFKWLRNR